VSLEAKLPGRESSGAAVIRLHGAHCDDAIVPTMERFGHQKLELANLRKWRHGTFE
jgi:uncharacterized membrane protein YraQ (UPF0718 family)